MDKDDVKARVDRQLERDEVCIYENENTQRTTRAPLEAFDEQGEYDTVTDTFLFFFLDFSQSSCAHDCCKKYGT